MTEFKFNEIAVGCDAEGFLLNKNGKPVSVEGLLGGLKGAPEKCEGGGYLEDCVAFEINPDPVPVSVGAEQFVRNIRSCIAAVEVKAQALNLSISLTPVQLFRKAQLSSEQANVSGCAVSYDAWQLERLDPIDLSKTNSRFASGDVHVSWPETEQGPYSRVNVARYLDLLIGITEVQVTERSVRNKFYGRAGTHRPTPYGVEYKAAGNFWLGTDEQIKWVFRQAEQAVTRSLEDGDGSSSVLNNMINHIVHCRKTWNKELASHMLSDWDVEPFPV